MHAVPHFGLVQWRGACWCLLWTCHPLGSIHGLYFLYVKRWWAISPNPPFICFLRFYKALSYFRPAESFPGTRALATWLLHVWQLVHTPLLLLPLSVPLPTALYLFSRLGTHLHVGFKMQRGFTLWQSSVLFLIFVPYLIIPIILFATSTATEQWADIFLVLTPIVTSRLFLWCQWSSQKLSFYILGFFSPHLWRITYSWLFWICHMLVSSDILYFLYWRNLKNR